MKWPCATDSYPRTFQSKPFYSKDLSHRKETIANRYTDRPHPFASYSVTRINPLYIVETNVDCRYAYDSIDDGEECTAQPCGTEYLHSSPLCDDSVAVLERDPDFIRSILVSVRLGRCHQRSHGLTPIPEDKVDSIPRPVWPNDDPTDKVRSAANHPPAKQQRRHHCQQREPRNHSSGCAKNDRVSVEAERQPDGVGPSFGDAASAAALLPPALAHILRQLSHNINDAMENADRVEIPADAVLRSLRAKINSCLETISAKEAAPYAADTVADLYERGSGDSGCVLGDRSVVATLSRAFSFVNAFHKDGSHRRHRDGDGNVDEDDDDDVERGRLMLLKRLGRFPPPAPSNHRAANDAGYERLQRSSSGSGSGSGAAGGSGSSSSAASTSGFSDLTHTPVSSNSSTSDSPPASRSTESSHGVTGAAACLASGTDDLCQQRRSESSSSGISGEGSAGSGGVEAAVKDGRDAVEAVVGRPSFASSFPYHAIPNRTTVSGDVPSRSGSTCGIVVKAIGCPAQTTSAHSKTDTLLSSYPGHRCPDFTLDVQQAEKVMKKIQERKKERCWCRLVTSFVGFVFLLFSVMFFSMMFTRGDKMFGPL